MSGSGQLRPGSVVRRLVAMADPKNSDVIAVIELRMPLPDVIAEWWAQMDLGVAGQAMVRQAIRTAPDGEFEVVFRRKGDGRG